jgi:Methyltransferase domain
VFEAEQPWPMPALEECKFYHSLDFPDGEKITGHWDIRTRFEQYIGGYQLSGKTVLDVGTASGFLSYSAEALGARVTAVDARHASEFDRIRFYDSLYHHDRMAWAEQWSDYWFRPLKNGFWYAWHKFNSRVEVIYAPVREFHLWDRRFDIVVAGAIVEHLSDPVAAITAFSRLANEAVIIAFTDVDDSDDLRMRAMNNWSDRNFDYTWWMLSRGLYQRVFENVGFEVEFVPASALNVPAFSNNLQVPSDVVRSTIIARRVK